MYRGAYLSEWDSESDRILSWNFSRAGLKRRGFRLWIIGIFEPSVNVGLIFIYFFFFGLEMDGMDEAVFTFSVDLLEEM